MGCIGGQRGGSPRIGDSINALEGRPNGLPSLAIYASALRRCFLNPESIVLGVNDGNNHW